ncbi:RTA1 like protein [Cadophora sp. DSE1049]|nr:RTA1 like protein [Cadophora sp. DSE1049]
MAEKESNWKYAPSIAAGAIATIVFTVLTVAHTSRLFKTRTWFCIPFVIGGLFEVIGFAARAASNKNRETLGLLVIQAVLILLAPILFAASVYMILGRLIRATGGEAYAIMRPTRITKIFVGGDFLCFQIQGAGGGMLSSAKTAAAKKRGEMIILSGLLLQIVIFGFFLLVALIFHKRLHNRPTAKSLNARFSCHKMLMQLYAVSALITVRNIFRAIEYVGGEDAYLLKVEWPIYVFDALLMAFVLCICYFWYVGSFENSEDDIALRSAESGVEATAAR